jgi:hypothetical protein
LYFPRRQRRRNVLPAKRNAIATVFTFWQLRSEEKTFLRYLARGGEVVAIRHQEAVHDPAAIRAEPVADLIGRHDAGRLYLTG